MQELDRRADMADERSKDSKPATDDKAKAELEEMERRAAEAERANREFDRDTPYPIETLRPGGLRGSPD